MVTKEERVIKERVIKERVIRESDQKPIKCHKLS